MFSIRATRRSGDGLEQRRSGRHGRPSILAYDGADAVEPGDFYEELGFHPPER